MQIEIDIEKLVSRSVIDGLTKSERFQEEIMDNEECRELLMTHVKNRLEDVLSSEEGKEKIDAAIIDKLSESDSIQCEIEDLLEKDEYQKILTDSIKNSLTEAMSSEETREEILNKVKSYLENYDIEEDSDLVDELNREMSRILITTIKCLFEKK